MHKQSDLLHHEREVEGLLVRYARDRLLSAVLTLDLAIRRSARRLLAPPESRASYPSSRRDSA